MLLESWVVQQITAQTAWTDPSLQCYHFRDKDQLEVDLVITRGARVWGVEVKAGTSVNASDCRGLERLATLAGKNFVRGIVLYDALRSLTAARSDDLHLHQASERRSCRRRMLRALQATSGAFEFLEFPLGDGVDF